MQRPTIILLAWISLHCVVQSSAGDEPSKREAAQALRRAVRFFREEVSASGGYLWRYSSDLASREGEGRASRTTAWVQPPGTPSVGDALLFAYHATGEKEYLSAARESAFALVDGQLKSGGWDYRIVFDSKDRRKYAYRTSGQANAKSMRNVTTLDDDTTQSALRFLMRVDQALDFTDDRIHKTTEYAIAKLLDTQYPNGAWPQRFSEPPDPKLHPVRKANYPESWSRTYRKVDYRNYYTFNDNTIADMIDTMFLASHIYENIQCADAAKRAGDFIVLAQMPEPQPAWAQQYDARMNPAWARKFEPPAVTGGESQGIIRTLMNLYRHTGDQKYLAPIPKALRYLKASELPNGQLARFYELKTNRPLYFTTNYTLTYDDSDLPTHYGFKVTSKVDRLRAEFDKLIKLDVNNLVPQGHMPKFKMSKSLAQKTALIIQSMDERGAWVEQGRMKTHENANVIDVIETNSFIENVRTLSIFVAASD